MGDVQMLLARKGDGGRLPLFPSVVYDGLPGTEPIGM
jgi:hypothetical protein